VERKWTSERARRLWKGYCESFAATFGVSARKRRKKEKIKKGKRRKNLRIICGYNSKLVRKRRRTEKRKKGKRRKKKERSQYK
jgi:hypothetical protein